MLESTFKFPGGATGAIGRVSTLTVSETGPKPMGFSPLTVTEYGLQGDNPKIVSDVVAWFSVLVSDCPVSTLVYVMW